MYDIMTGTENFIANGLVSHNCYVPSVLRMSRAEFDAGANPRPDFINLLTKDARKYQAAGIREQVMLSFTTDPYNPGDVERALTRQTIEVLKAHGLGFCTLTKGGSRALRDLDLFRPDRDAFASTLTSLDPAVSLEWESGAALPDDRIATLKRFHDAGIFTWVSLEPVYDTEATLEIIEATHEFVDLYKIGRINYHRLTKEIDWRDFAGRVVEMVSRLGAGHYIKKDLQPFLPAGYPNPRYVPQHH
jgi:DNA repair photolyase